MTEIVSPQPGEHWTVTRSKDVHVTRVVDGGLYDLDGGYWELNPDVRNGWTNEWTKVEPAVIQAGGWCAPTDNLFNFFDPFKKRTELEIANDEIYELKRKLAKAEKHAARSAKALAKLVLK